MRAPLGIRYLVLSVQSVHKGALSVTVNESQMEIPAERRQDFVWHVEQRNEKTYLKFNVGENRENVSERNM